MHQNHHPSRKTDLRIEGYREAQAQEFWILDWLGIDNSADSEKLLPSLPVDWGLNLSVICPEDVSAGQVPLRNRKDVFLLLQNSKSLDTGQADNL